MWYAVEITGGTMSTYDIIHEAIANRLIVRATYRGHERVMCPHVLGTKGTGPAARQQALFYQFAGHSSSGLGRDGDPGNWRCMFLDELSDVTAEIGDWHTAPNHSRPQTCVDDVSISTVYVED